MTTIPASSALSAASGRAAALPAILAALMLGIVVLYGAGFAGADVLHNAAHDTRHALGYPCH
ncbi:MAG: CbtB-domain containing protein [Geminicoccaceae bacterium]|nr:CbtB-domain containing protein [Geminicoccaceae bacterium]MCB2055773.1 CbtB-domain containing protein [Geminicoccaceae bacterium]